jgi:hypothetical protein
MPRHTVLVHDRRLWGDPPTGKDITVVRVSERTPLSRLVQCINNLSFQYGSEIEVRVMCHGYEDAAGHGGFGLELCQESLTLATVAQLAPLNGNLSYYWVIYSCGAADVAPGRQGLHGDGRMLMSEIARRTGTGVFAADATQRYIALSLGSWCILPIDFGGWEGNLLEFSATGRRESNPRAPRSL